MNKFNISIIIVCIALSIGLYITYRKVNEQDKYWKVMIENSPKEVQDFFYAEVEKIK